MGIAYIIRYIWLQNMRRFDKKNSFISVPFIAGIAALISLLAQYGFYLSPKTLDFFRYLDKIITKKSSIIKRNLLGKEDIMVCAKEAE